MNFFPNAPLRDKFIQTARFSFDLFVHYTRVEIDAYGQHSIELRAGVGGYILDAKCEVQMCSKPENTRMMIKDIEPSRNLELKLFH